MSEPFIEGERFDGERVVYIRELHMRDVHTVFIRFDPPNEGWIQDLESFDIEDAFVDVVDGRIVGLNLAWIDEGARHVEGEDLPTE